MLPSLTRRAALRGAAGAVAGAYLIDRLGPPEARAQAPAPSGKRDADYWAFADGVQQLVDDQWQEGDHLYGRGDTAINSNILFTHAAAAQAGHRGRARNDDRANRLAWRLCQHYPWRPHPSDPPVAGASSPVGRISKDQTHYHGWSPSMHVMSQMHVVIDTAVVRALTQAYLAREALGMPEGTAALVRDRLVRCATDGFYRYPSIRLNQINWPAEIYAAHAAVTGSPTLLRDDYRRQLVRFAGHITRAERGKVLPNLGPGYRFHYLPQFTARQKANVDSAEYALIVVQALAFYEQALRVGMRPLPSAHVRRLRAWCERILSGYWTHGGYLNWDTGMGFQRWHQGKKHGLGHQGILALATAPRFLPSAEHAAWAKHFFDRGLDLFVAFSLEAGGLPPAVPYGVTRTPGSVGDAYLWATRMQANAANAVVRGLGSAPAEEPPPLYAFDPDTGRLAVTTPAYNTAVMPVNQKAFPYGGVELARLYDGDQRVASNIGGKAPAGFGVTVRSHRTGRTLASQKPRRWPSRTEPRLRLTRAPRGVGSRLAKYPARPYAGRFSAVDAEGWTRRDGVAVRTRHRFRRRYVETAWTILSRGAKGDHTARLHFPSWTRQATVTVHRRGGGTTVLAGAASLSLRDIAWVHVAHAGSGYVIVPRDLPRGRAHLAEVGKQASNPQPGPSLILEVLREARLRRIDAAVRVAPARDAEDAARVAAALGA